VKDAGTAGARVTGALQVRMTTQNFGDGVAVVDAAREDAVRARMLALLAKYHPIELHSAERLVLAQNGDVAAALRLLVDEYGFEPGAVVCLRIDRVLPGPRSCSVDLSGAYFKVSSTADPATRQRAWAVDAATGLVDGAAVGVAVPVSQTTDAVEVRLKVHRGVRGATVLGSVLVPICLPASEAVRGAGSSERSHCQLVLPVFATATGEVQCRVAVTVLSTPAAFDASQWSPWWSDVLPARAGALWWVLELVATQFDAALAPRLLVDDVVQRAQVHPASFPTGDAALRCVFVRVLACRGLPKMDTFGTCDPFVVIEGGRPCANFSRTATKWGTQNADFSTGDRNLLLAVANAADAVALRFFDQDTVSDDEFGYMPLPSLAQLQALVRRGAIGGGDQAVWAPIVGPGGEKHGWVCVQIGVATLQPPPEPVPRAFEALPEVGTFEAALHRLARFYVKYDPLRARTVWSAASECFLSGTLEATMARLRDEWGPEP
jgi:hypothetical protein